MVSTFRESIIFFEKLGLFDVILPFILVFTVVFAILEKTKVFGQEELDGKKYTRKNVNAMVAFVIAFLVVASAQLVEIITTVSSWMVLLLMLSVLFLILIGSFSKEGEPIALKDRWNTTFMILMFIGIVVIFLEAIKTESGKSWLTWIFEYLKFQFRSTAVASLLLMFIIIFAMWFIYREPGKK